ncbi:lambda exonuclease family protein [Wohlfahrtiimonas populi]|uniref:lambda exonuclease family protein n=1 Tax=Wohlfahrtiimonas populi TaxID=1940240 RepID=UPI00098CFFC4|nr:lambda exonuclease family protein [Wohlfahrtiimonas populi]
MDNNELQRTEDWFSARRGKVTASRLYDAVATQKNGSYYAARENYIVEIALEIITGNTPDSFKSDAMQRGIDLEPKAKEAYTLSTMNEVQDVGFIDHPTIERFGASPDGLILDMMGEPLKKGIEIKCPNSATHLKTLETGVINPQYIYQMYAQMMCTGFDHWVFMSYDDRFPAHLQSFIVEIGITDEIKEKIEFEVNKFNAEVDQIVEKLMNIKEVA